MRPLACHCTSCVAKGCKKWVAVQALTQPAPVFWRSQLTISVVPVCRICARGQRLGDPCAGADHWRRAGCRRQGKLQCWLCLQLRHFAAAGAATSAWCTTGFPCDSRAVMYCGPVVRSSRSITYHAVHGAEVAACYAATAATAQTAVQIPPLCSLQNRSLPSYQRLSCCGDTCRAEAPAAHSCSACLPFSSHALLPLSSYATFHDITDRPLAPCIAASGAKGSEGQGPIESGVGPHHVSQG